MSMSAEIRNVGVLGAGTMGNGIAQAFAVAGYPVTMRDVKPEFVDRGMATIAKSLERLAARGKLAGEVRDAALARIKPTTELKDFAACDLVVEAILENYELKAGVIRELAAICRPEAIFATNTSSISVTQIAAASQRPDRVVGMHFFNPVPMMQLVEVIRALQTSDTVCQSVVALVASLEDIDTMMKLGANHPMGPLSLADLIGLDIVLDIMETLYEGFDDPKFRPSPLLKQMCHAGYLGRKKGRGFFTYAA